MIQTPGYVFDIDAFRGQIRRVKKAWEIGLCYSVKANPFLVGKTPEEIDWLEVCSPGELEICKEKGVDPKKILFSGVNKTAQSVKDAFDYGVGIFTAESILHADLIDQEAKARNTKAKTLLRLSAGSQFGMSEEDLTKILAAQKEGAYANIQIVGIHYFSGTQKTKVKEIAKEVEALDAFLQTLKAQFDFIPEQIEYGTGLGVEYFISTKDGAEDGTPDAKDEALLAEVAPVLKDFAAKYPLTVEMGRFFAAGCGSYHTEVVDIKTTHGINYVICDGGINHLKYQGQVMGMHVPQIRVRGKETDAPKETEATKAYCICGSLCTTADVLVRKAELPELTIGDVLVFEKTGAYSVTEGLALFLSRELAAVYLKEGDNYTNVRPVTPVHALNS